ncbi:MAG TPA: EAL domain-containing protein, partial [Aestuariivirgaceae bacterium]|nr:EAL domain-containing protein [Aestuariivirgaceae bacterium]
FFDRLEVAMRRAHTETNNELYVIVIDLDRFKTVNDGLGHEVGDSLLSVTGRRLQGLIGPEDTLARLPGDQFAIIFNGRRPKRDVIPFTEQVRTTLSRPIKLRGRELFLTASFGVARFVDDRTSGPDFVKDAEIALYEAKRRGRDSTEFFRADMRDDRSELLTLEQDLRRAVERNEIEVVYQPITRLSDMQLAGFEALIRWRHRTEGLLSPDAFMGLAEETGIIKDLSRLVLNESARQLGIWQRAFRPDKPLFVSVNVSSSQLLNTELVDDVRALLGREDIIEGTLKVELTESMVMENPELSIEVLERLKSLGVGLACDDFGTGYSALANLRRLPFDMLKIDRSFLEADPEDEKAMIVLETIILLAHDLRLSVVAEGIEDQDQIARLAELECDFAQGFLIGEPMSAKQVIEALGGGTFATAKPGGTGFWGRITGRGPAREPSAPPPPGTAPMATTPPGAVPVAPAIDDLDDILEPEVPPVEEEKEEVIALGDATEPAVEAEETDVPKLPSEEPAAAKVEEEKPKLVAKPASEPVRPSVSFRSMLTLPDPEALPPVPPPPPRPADIFGISPKEAVKSPPRSEKLAPRAPSAKALEPEPELHGSNGSEPPLIAEEVEAGEMPVPPPPQAAEPTEVAAEATIVEAQPKQNRRRSKSSK